MQCDFVGFVMLQLKCLNLLSHFLFLAHLSWRLIGELKYSQASVVHPSLLSVVICQHFQRTSPLKPWSRFLPYFTYSIYRQGGTYQIVFCPNRIRTLVAMATYICRWLIMGKNENWHLLLSQCRFFDKTFTEMFLEWSSTKHTFFVVTAKFDWLPWQPKGKICEKINSSEAVWGIKLNLWRIVSNINIYESIVFYVAHSLWLLLKVAIDLQWEKWKLNFIAIPMQIFW